MSIYIHHQNVDLPWLGRHAGIISVPRLPVQRLHGHHTTLRIRSN